MRACSKPSSLMKPLDLYAKIESLIGFDAQYESLYQTYLEKLRSLHVNTVLDIGCGNGKFLAHLAHEGYRALGIDRSAAMVERALSLGVNASTQELENFENNTFDGIVAIADVLNYMSTEELQHFLAQVHRVLKPKGYFLCDINTLYGFENVADGVMAKEDEKHFLCVEASYENKQLLTHFTLFEKENELYQKYSADIMQYYHAPSWFKKLRGWKIVHQKSITLFSDEADKLLMCFQKI